MITRRAAIAAAAGALCSTRSGFTQTLRNLGGAPAGFPVRNRAARGGAQPFDLVEHCRSLGLGVVETRLPPGGPDAIPAFRRRIESAGMRVILDIGYPRDEAGLPAFEANAKAAKECGAYSLHAAMTGR